MTHAFRRAIVSLTLAPYLALSLTPAREHVHEADADHPHSTAHRHLDPHHPGHDHDHAQLADDDGHVMWLDMVTVQQATLHVPAPQDLPRAIPDPVPVTSGWTAIVNYVAAPAHGPPRAAFSLRGPPCLPA